MLMTAAIVALALTAAELDFVVLPDPANSTAVPSGGADATRYRAVAGGSYGTLPNRTYPDPADEAVTCYTTSTLNSLTVTLLKNGRPISERTHSGPLASAGKWAAEPVETALAPADRLAVRLTLAGGCATFRTGRDGVVKLDDVPFRRVKLVPLPNHRAAPPPGHR